MIVTLSVPEVHKLRHLLYKAHVDTYNKTYDIKGANNESRTLYF